MDSYLSIAERVLRQVRRPMNAREILETAYLRGMVPHDLFGKTQHKTLGARLSEEILSRRDRSLFYRSQPGRFFLREFLNDPTIPTVFRSPILARRRQRELRKGDPLTLSKSTVVNATSAPLPPNTIQAFISEVEFHYAAQGGLKKPEQLLVWSFVVVVRGREVLTYRHGRYREGRDAFLQRRSVGFFTPVVERDRDLFDNGDCGIVASGLRAIALDLDLPPSIISGAEYNSLASITDLLVAADETGHEDILAVVAFQCPHQFEPLTRRLAINDIAWMRFDVPPNQTDDFDPWSQQVMQRARSGFEPFGGA